MKVIIISGKHGESRTLSLSRWTLTFLSLCLLGAPLAGGYLGYKSLSSGGEVFDEKTLKILKNQIDEQQSEIAETKQLTDEQLQALTLRMAQLQARLVRLDAVGERITTVAKLDKGEFNFDDVPAVGGPETEPVTTANDPNLIAAIDDLQARVEERGQQLEILQTLLANRKIDEETLLAGRPIKKGWMSSRFGMRNDPFTGHRSMHEGVDFAGKRGSDIISVGAGVVTWSGDRYGYGRMVEVNHGGGYITRYAHNQENLVKVGDIVKKGQVLALMGSSGRSTGPHVHFEVYKHGRPVDPATYIRRTRR